jgi:hypothetical protein
LKLLGFAICWAGYALMWWGWSSIQGPGVGIMDLVVPGRVPAHNMAGQNTVGPVPQGTVPSSNPVLLAPFPVVPTNQIGAGFTQAPILGGQQ